MAEETVTVSLNGRQVTWKVSEAVAVQLAQTLVQSIGPAIDAPTKEYRVNDAIGWDDRKDLSWEWQKHAPITDLSNATYEALLAVAKWGARRLITHEED